MRWLTRRIAERRKILLRQMRAHFRLGIRLGKMGVSAQSVHIWGADLDRTQRIALLTGYLRGIEWKRKAQTASP